MSVWSALLLFRFVLNKLFRLCLNRLDAKKKTECCIFTLIVTNITKNRNVLQNYIFLFLRNCGCTFVLLKLINDKKQKTIWKHKTKLRFILLRKKTSILQDFTRTRTQPILLIGAIYQDLFLSI